MTNRRRGWLRNGAAPGDFSSAPRCGATTRQGSACQCPAMLNGRCRLHGGISTGPKTAKGIERIRRALTKHGRYSTAAIAERRCVQAHIKKSRALLAIVAEWDRIDSEATGGRLQVQQELNKREVLLAALRDWEG